MKGTTIKQRVELQLLLLDYNISDNRFYLRHVHLLLKNS